MIGLLALLKGLPWKLIGIGLIVLLIFASGLGLIHFGRTFEKQKATIEAQKKAMETMQGQINDCLEQRQDLVDVIDGLNVSLGELHDHAAEVEAAYNAAINRPPVISYLPYADRAAAEIPTDDCGRAAAAAWRLLETSMWLENHP